MTIRDLLAIVCDDSTGVDIDDEIYISSDDEGNRLSEVSDDYGSDAGCITLYPGKQVDA